MRRDSWFDIQPGDLVYDSTGCWVALSVSDPESLLGLPDHRTVCWLSCYAAAAKGRVFDEPVLGTYTVVPFMEDCEESETLMRVG